MPAKLQFSEQESSIVKDAELILTKNRIIVKLQQVFGGVAASFQEDFNQGRWQLPAEVLQIPPKVSKGEQYRGLPYVMLDYPRFFSKEDVLAVRTFFWWGHHCSVTVHLKGIYLQKYLPFLLQNLKKGKLNGFRICTDGDEWNHNVEEYKPTDAFELLNNPLFLKIGKALPLENWPEMEANLIQLGKELLEALGQNQLPSR